MTIVNDVAVVLNRPRAQVDHKRAVDAVRELLLACGRDLSHDSLADTPDRVARMFSELLTGYGQDDSCLDRVFDTDTEDTGLVLLRGIEFHSMCEHHLLPFSGTAHVGYIPSAGKVVGLSKLARIVEVYARRLQLQERLARQVADALQRKLSPVGVAVVMEAQHGCMECRGVKQSDATMITSVLRGAFHTDPAARAELFSMLRGIE